MVYCVVGSFDMSALQNTTLNKSEGTCHGVQNDDYLDLAPLAILTA